MKNLIYIFRIENEEGKMIISIICDTYENVLFIVNNNKYVFTFCRKKCIIFTTKKGEIKVRKKENYTELIELTIDSLPYNSVITSNDFVNIAKMKTVNKILSRIEQNGKIKKIITGFYYKPKYSKLLKEYSSIDIENLVNAIAKKHNWIISPSGNTALNYLHLSTQVTNSWDFISSGPNREYVIGKNVIKFHKVASKDIQGYSKKTILLIQALKKIGKENISDNDIYILINVLSKKEKIDAKEEAKFTSSWIYEIIKKIYMGDTNVRNN